MVGYVKSQYLENIRPYSPEAETVPEMEDARPLSEQQAAMAAKVAQGFQENYKAFAVGKIAMYAEMDERSNVSRYIPLYEEVIVSAIEGEWCYARYEKSTGYIRLKSLFKWDRINPYAGDIPGCVVYPTLAFVDKTIDVYDLENGELLKTLYPGSALGVEKPDEAGRCATPYWRTTGYVQQSDISYTVDVVPWADAQPGDLISVMSTYYAVGERTLQYMGRNWNIYLSTSMLSGVVLQPGEQLNVNKTIGPYRKSTGYKEAPIMSPNALTGYGGGTCQVNTTLYNTIIQLPIFVDHRRVHANVGVKYIPKGFDAAVGAGAINMIFTNTLPYAIRFLYFVSDGVMTCCIFRE